MMAVLSKSKCFVLAFFPKSKGMVLAFSPLKFGVIIFCLIILPLILTAHTTTSNAILSPSDILSSVKTKCVVAISYRSWLKATEDFNFTDDTSSSVVELLRVANMAFHEETKVLIGFCHFEYFIWPSGAKLSSESGVDISLQTVALFPQTTEDRTCLLKPDSLVTYPKAVIYDGPIVGIGLVDFINHYCNTYRNLDGSLTLKGLHREAILKDLFSVRHLNSARIFDIFKNIKPDQQEHCFKKDCNTLDNCPGNSKMNIANNNHLFSECERITLPTKEEFFNNFLSRSKPVIIRGAMENWPALYKWTNEFLLREYGDKEVHIKLTPSGEYEGIEPASLWENFHTFKIPPSVLKKLPYPDLVVVRPASLNMKLSEFLSIIKNISSGQLSNFSAYLEYTAISDYFPELAKDIQEMPFFKNMLQLQHLNIWLSDGNTLGKTHFDPYDNFLCQVSGQKEITLFEPHSDELYEAHIPEALLSYNTTTKMFRRKKLLDSTSMVMSPIDILQPNLQRFPKFHEAHPLYCKIEEGEVLYLPAFWWHEVQSRPSATEHRNLAVNFWYEPFLMKEFPCPECRLDVNPKYRNLL